MRKHRFSKSYLMPVIYDDLPESARDQLADLLCLASLGATSESLAIWCELPEALVERILADHEDALYGRCKATVAINGPGWLPTPEGIEIAKPTHARGRRHADTYQPPRTAISLAELESIARDMERADS